MTAWLLACASCGAGGDSPLVLYPNEQVKAYVGETHSAGIMDTLQDGSIVPDAGPTSRDIFTVAAGASFLTDFFATVTYPYFTNERNGRSVGGAGDPQAEVRWTAVPATMLDARIPQVQLLAGYRRASGVSVFASKDPDELDVTSLGYDESRLGVDVWWGGRAFKYGVAETVRFAEPYSAEGVESLPGRALRSVLTAAYELVPGGKVSTGAVLDARERRRDGGVVVPDSEEVEHDAFVSADWQATPRLDTRVGVSWADAFGENKNTPRMASVTVALMGAL